MTEIDRLQKAVLDLHGCEGIHVRTVHVDEVFEGKPVCTGDVEEFLITEHPKAVRAYAWSYEDDSGETHYVAILGVPPVNTAQDAVKAYAVAHILKTQQ